MDVLSAIGEPTRAGVPAPSSSVEDVSFDEPLPDWSNVSQQRYTRVCAGPAITREACERCLQGDGGQPFEPANTHLVLYKRTVGTMCGTHLDELSGATGAERQEAR